VLSHAALTFVLDLCGVLGCCADIYVSVVSYHHQVAAKGKWVAVCSTVVEGKDAKAEIQPALALLDKIDQQ
jgi:Rab GDP dissociation inhibitor